MSFYNIQKIKNKLLQDKEKQSYVLIHDIGVDFRNLEKGDRFEELAKTNQKDLVDVFFQKLNDYCLDLSRKNIPFDSIKVLGKPGLIITSRKHQAILEKFLKEHYYFSCHYPEKASRDPFPWDVDLAKSEIQNIFISDTLYNLVPLDFRFEPYLTINTTEVSTNRFLGLGQNNESNFRATVSFNEFINALREKGCILEYDTDEVKTYEDYFSHIKHIHQYVDQLSIDINLNNENVKNR